jgi:hypothetical protein
MLRLLTIVKPNTVRLQGIDRSSKVLLHQVERVFQFECLESIEEFLFGRFHKGRTKDKVVRQTRSVIFQTNALVDNDILSKCYEFIGLDGKG